MPANIPGCHGPTDIPLCAEGERWAAVQRVVVCNAYVDKGLHHEVVRQMKGLGVTGGCTSDEKRPLMTYSEFIRILAQRGVKLYLTITCLSKIRVVFVGSASLGVFGQFLTPP